MINMTTAQTTVDTSIGFGLAEMAYLLHLQSTAGSQASASWLRLTEESENQEMVRAGLSSLIARGLASVTGSDVEFDERVDVVAYTMANAVRWSQLDLLLDAKGGDSVLHAESDRTKLILQPRTMMSWFALPQDPAISAEAAEAIIVRSHLNQNPGGGVRIRSGLHRSSRQMLVRKEDHGWIHALALDDVVGIEALARSDDDLTAALAAFRADERATDGN
ncbi:hypothetical protein [Arthrobacter sp. ISL-72]|uniref:hypothetical protein n=1 Tax=Arthrobacter sp. ISL-72 TaxID=2819114 RepID=UPI001BEC7C30|nr:hypothetical protein [Arthrobacter sp. ISL-72]MBT2594519.1 hypothetical protein [Arthrobacter sp. ISL-72]